MSNWDEELEDSNLVKDLRKQLKRLVDERDEALKEIGTLRPQVRKTSLTSILTSMGFNAKIAGLMPESVPPEKDAVATWLKDYGDLFNLKPEGKSEEKTAEQQIEEKPAPAQLADVLPAIDSATQTLWGQVQNAEAAAGSTLPDAEKQQLSLLGEAAAKSGGDFDAFIAALRGESPIPR